MKLKLRLFTVLSLLLAVSAWADNWKIDSFDDSPDPGDPDNFIDGDLKPVKPEQVSPQSNVLYVRQKFEDSFGDGESTYQIFKGRPTEAAKGLGKISLDGIPYQTLLKMKLFYKKNATGDDDLETVYFDGKDILVEGEDPVYINLNGKMEELSPSTSKDFKVSISSDPSGATVTIGGVNKGVTPITVSLAAPKTVTAVITKDGYYTSVKPITPVGKKTTEEGVALVAKKPLDNPATAYKSKFETAKSSKNTSAIKTLRTDVKKTLDNYNSDSKKAIEAVMSKYPANPPKAGEESSGDYSARQTIWNNAQAREREALNKEALGIFNELKELLAEIDASTAGLEFGLRYEYIPNSAITFNKMGVKDFSVTAELSNSRVKFNYKDARLDYGSLSRSEIENDQEGVHGVLKLWDTPNENGKYASIYNVAFFYDETPLKMLSKGSFSSSDATAKSKSTEKDLNNGIVKFAGRAAWEQADEAATLQTLRNGAPAVAAAKTQAAPMEEDEEEAVYDEEADEAAVEEGVAAQEKYDYSKYGASGNATQIFGNTDEYLFWTGVAFLAGAIGTGVVGFLQNSKYQDFKKEIDNIDGTIGEVEKNIRKECKEKFPANEDICYKELKRLSSEPPSDPNNDSWIEEGKPIWKLNQLRQENVDKGGKYNTSRIIFFSAAAVSLGISITLFAW